MTRERLLYLLGNIDDDLILEAGEKLRLLDRGASSDHSETEEDMNRKTITKFSKTVLIAAVVAAALIVTALAAGLFGTSVRETDGLQGTWGGDQSVDFYDARHYVTFESDQPRHEVLFKANWLPCEPTAGAGGEFTSYLANDGEGEVLHYVINTYNRTDLQGIRYCFQGEGGVVRQDLWNGFERTELTLDYTNSPIQFGTVNYLLLFQSEDNYLIYIGGTESMATLEKIAENLEIRVGEEITELYDTGSDIASFDLGRG